MAQTHYAAVASPSQAAGSAQPLPVVLPLEQQFRAALAAIPPRNEAYEQSLLARLRAGDRAARADLVTYLLPPLVLFTRRYLATHYRDVTPRFEVLDLVHEGVIAMLEAMDRADRANPCAYLLTIAQGAIRTLCRTRQSAITLPNTDGAAPWPLLSLERPLRGNNDSEPCTLLDLLAAAPTQTSSSPAESKPMLLREAIQSLTPLQQAVLTRRYGLFDVAPHTVAEVAQALYGEASMRHRKRCIALHAYALDTLRARLAAVSPTGGTPARPHRERYAPTQQYAYERIRLSEAQRARLDAAAARLLARGEKLTLRRLAREAGMAGGPVSRYLSEREMPRHEVRQREQQRREDALRATYARLVAQGEKISGNRLAREAGVAIPAAQAFLKNPLFATQGGQA